MNHLGLGLKKKCLLSYFPPKCEDGSLLGPREELVGNKQIKRFLGIRESL